MADEIAAQLALEEAGLTAAEQFAASELENEMTDITFEAYKNRNETVKESVNEAPQKEVSWWSLDGKRFTTSACGLCVRVFNNKFSA